MAGDHSCSPPLATQGTRPITRAALYARVSTLIGQNPEMQLAELREYASRRGWAIADEYIDRGVSGAKESRPALTRLMRDAHRRRFDAVLVWKLDRFARSLKQLVNALAEMEALGVAFVSLRDNLDLSTPSGRLMFQIIGAMAEFERALIQERVRAGLRHARAQGKRLGRPGVNVEGKRIRELRAHGASLRTIARQLGVGLGTVHRALPARSKSVSKGIVGGDATFARQLERPIVVVAGGSTEPHAYTGEGVEAISPCTSPVGQATEPTLPPSCLSDYNRVVHV